MRARPQRAVTCPVQKLDQVPARVSAGCQVDRYGERTISGVAGGRIGLKVPAAAAVPGSHSAAATAAAVPPASRSRSRGGGGGGFRGGIGGPLPGGGARGGANFSTVGQTL